VAWEIGPAAPGPKKKPSKIVTSKQDSDLIKSRKWLAEQTGIDEVRWTDSAVKQMQQLTPAPVTWKNRVMICAPLAELGYTFFWQMLVGQVRHVGWHIDNSLLMTNSGQYLPDAHNSMVKACLEIPGWNYLLWMEHDHSYPSNLLELIGEEYTDPVISGLYFNRVIEDPQPVIYNWNPQRTAIGRLQPYQMAPILEKRGLYEVDVVPMGCTAIRRDVFENWPKDIPFYAAPTSPKNGRVMSDDVWFCRHAQDQGYKIKVDSRIIAKHYSLVGVDDRFYVSWIKQLRKEGNTGPREEKVWPGTDIPSVSVNGSEPVEVQ